MNLIRSVLAAMVLAVVVPAQAGNAPKPAPGQAEYDKLVAEWTAANTAYQEANKKVMASDEYKKAREDKDTAKQRELMASVKRPDTKPFGDRAIALADQFAGDDGLRFLVYAAQNFTDKDTGTAVVERVEKSYLKSAKLGDLLENPMALSRSAGVEAANALLERVKTESPHALPKAWAFYWQGKNTQQKARPPRDATDEQKAAAAAAAAEADKLFAAAAPLAAGTEFADKIGAPVYEKQKLQPGMEVPDIVGEDVDGVAFKLSDYRGKVVLLDYWGFW
jgi:hypothetical protein